MALEYFHEPREQLPPAVLNLKRALASIIEELEAVSWYNERAAGETDAELIEILLHNRNEEIEHAMMLLEWVRRKYPEFAEEMKTYMFTKAPITELEDAQQGSEQQQTSNPANGSLNIGTMKGE